MRERREHRPEAGSQAVIPPEEIAGDDRGDAQGPQMQHTRVTPQFALFEILRTGFAHVNRILACR